MSDWTLTIYIVNEFIMSIWQSCLTADPKNAWKEFISAMTFVLRTANLESINFKLLSDNVLYRDYYAYSEALCPDWVDCMNGIVIVSVLV